ncbi:hypothetical protein A2303_05240 [Candidatus Falkowbacteria bacterium RIFOXYB2_FULL_47_14]|uniref:DUF7897 domain-containing protein n=1 Tax=Candidatus Falkowbacteria bacterium RIFOXYA2_FULL_47_19 TaxID=1797994 RepID=A0A1F5SJ79_9BACT|nr:MAG: hypothetical protein A2227_06620 [Candidatus Falkowbacteria bacterium RIFOXYA2_FULL_47_19]OGF35412.1 MAG: hypothetical protein A2468_02990 [Candidatus Falkowbacteria bacterium RIFOXYC2_FULL_46_15]OGF43319.1 MAG: hypothetical protein A2303_05240 [Candidatus Falkowbacteria bacterium RIFOXYB2_FULL_47_14]
MANPIVRSLLEKDFRIEIEPHWSLPEMADNVIGEVGRHIAGRNDLKALLEMLPKGIFTLCPDSPPEELHKYLINRYGKIDKSDPRVVLAFMENFVSEAAALERRSMAKGATRIKDIAADELVLLADPFVPAAADKLWYRWYKELVIPLEILPEEEKTVRKAELKSIMNEYDYTVFAAGERLAWARAFPAEIAELARAITALGNRLRDRSLKRYLSFLARAYTCAKTEDLEKRWTEVDYAWIDIPNDTRVFPVHGMEAGYEHPCGVSPEWNIVVRLDRGKKEIGEIREAAPGVAGSCGADAGLLKHKLDRVDIGIFYTAVWAGNSMNFRIAGQAVPNRQEVLKRGGKIFIDLDSEKLAVERYRDMLDKYLPAETARILKAQISVMSMIEHTAGHEVSHPAGRSEEIDRKLGSALKLLEEAKATMSGNLINESRNGENRLRIVAETIARFCRFFYKTSLENPSATQYVWENMIACRTMHEAGVIRMGEDRIEVDLENAKGPDWFDRLEKFVRGVFAAYEAGDSEALEKTHRELCGRDGIVADIIALVNK